MAEDNPNRRNKSKGIQPQDSRLLADWFHFIFNLPQIPARSAENPPAVILLYLLVPRGFSSPFSLTMTASSWPKAPVPATSGNRNRAITGGPAPSFSAWPMLHASGSARAPACRVERPR